MASPCVLLRTKERESFAYQNRYEGVNTSDLETLLKLGRETVCSLEVELESRQVVAKLEESNAVAECAEKLRQSMGDLFHIGFQLVQQDITMYVIPFLSNAQYTFGTGMEVWEAINCIAAASEEAVMFANATSPVRAGLVGARA